MDSGSMVIRGYNRAALILSISGALATAKYFDGAISKLVVPEGDSPIKHAEGALSDEEASRTPKENNISFLKEWISKYKAQEIVDVSKELDLSVAQSQEKIKEINNE